MKWYWRYIGQRLIGILFCVGIFFNLALYDIPWHPYTFAKSVYWEWESCLGKETTPPNIQQVCECLRNAVRNAVQSSRNNPLGKRADQHLINVFGSIQVLLDIQSVRDDLSHWCRLKNGYVAMLVPRQDNTEAADALIQFDRWLKTKNIPFLFVQAPHLVCKYAPELPRGATCFSDDNTNRLLDYLREAGVDCLDTREIFRDCPQKHYECFLKSETHWQMEYAFYAFQQTGRHLNEKYGFSIPPEVLDADNYYRVRDDSVLYGQGERLGETFVPEDHKVFFLPKFPTQFISDQEIYWPRKMLHQEGSFDILMPPRTMEERVINQNIPSKRVLLITDSFGANFSRYMPLGCHEMVFVCPLRYHSDLDEKLKQMQPDIVILLLTARGVGRLYTDYITLPLETRYTHRRLKFPFCATLCEPWCASSDGGRHRKFQREVL
ncbi:MAG: hypothetical protein Q4D38_01785 [Planctomycetia bacterium]|nr:hypothetical protein [Planctomycetia bacterium]